MGWEVRGFTNMCVCVCVCVCVGVGGEVEELILGAFAKLRNATVSVVSVRPSASNFSAPTGHIFMKFDI